MERTSEHFQPELLNLLNSMLVFNKLSKASIMQVVDLRLADVAQRLAPRRITMDVDPSAKEWLVAQGYSEAYGARAIARIVRSKVLFPLAQKLLKGTIRDGDVVHIRATEDGNALDIGDNHAPDPTIAHSSTPIALEPDNQETTQS